MAIHDEETKEIHEFMSHKNFNERKVREKLRDKNAAVAKITPQDVDGDIVKIKTVKSSIHKR